MITKVTDQIYRGPHPEMMIDLQRLGIRSILSLQTGAQDMFRGRTYVEDEEAEKVGISVSHLRLDNLRPPTKDQVTRCLRVMTYPPALPIYVHCKHGVDRTGFIIAAYRVLVQGWDVEDALEEMYELGHHRWFYWYWTPAFRKRMAEMRPMYAEAQS